MEVLKNNEKLVARTRDFRAGTIGIKGVNDAYDLYLAGLPDGNYVLIVFMKVQFFFKDSGNEKWSHSEKISFVENWKQIIQNSWGKNRVVKTLKNGKKVSIDFRFQTRIGGWMADHWEVTVTRIPKGAFKQSMVNPILGNVYLDSEDSTFKQKAGGKFQRGAVHEFGHMLGLEDEYPQTSKYSADYDSVMNSGESIFSRHDAYYIKWLDKVLKQ
jgi:hypothetical protein